MNVPERELFIEFSPLSRYLFPSGNTMPTRHPPEDMHDGVKHAARFGALVRERREALRMTQDDLALTTGVGRRFIVELEAGKPSCQLGKALVVAAAVGLRPFDLMSEDNTDNALLPDLPDLPETAEEPWRG